MSEDTERYLPHIQIPDGENWRCERCGATGDSTEQTICEHFEAAHGERGER